VAAGLTRNRPLDPSTDLRDETLQGGRAVAHFTEEIAGAVQIENPAPINMKMA
jgi:hypothetical protein